VSFEVDGDWIDQLSLEQTLKLLGALDAGAIAAVTIAAKEAFRARLRGPIDSARRVQELSSPLEAKLR
jgi:hypothetical protein